MVKLDKMIVKQPCALAAYRALATRAKIPKDIISYYPSYLAAKLPVAIISYTILKLPVLEMLHVSQEGITIRATGKFSDMGTGDIVRCGFAVNTVPNLEGANFYDAVLIPGDSTFSLDIGNVWSGTVYIAAFAENPAGIAHSNFLTVTAECGWEGGKIYGISPAAITGFIIGGDTIKRDVTKNVYVGNRKI